MNNQGSLTLFSPTVWMPEQIEEAWKLKQEYGADACYIAGGTLLQTHWKKGVQPPPHFISLERIKEMQARELVLEGDRSVMLLGALTTLDICRNDADIFKIAPLIREAAGKTASPAIRNRGTIGGNIENGFGDMITALLAIDATVSYYDGENRKKESLWHYLMKKKTLSHAILINVYVPEEMTMPKTVHFYQKIGLREAFTPSLLTVSGYCSLTKQGEIQHIRIAAGGAAIPPQRLINCERAIMGSNPKEVDWEHVHLAITEEFITSSDAFVSADYKRLAAANMIISELSRLSE